MENKIEIKIKEGLNELKFGFTMDEVKKILGNPDETEIDEDADNKTEIWYYWDHGITVFFDYSDEKRCTCLETENIDAALLGKAVSELKEADIKELFSQKGYKDFETEDEAWGERRISINDAVIDIYFNEGEVVSVNWGVDYNDEEKPLWP
jgi:hypothetical protein